MKPNPSDHFIASLYGIRDKPLPEAVARQARRCLLDYVGVTLAGAVMLGSKGNGLLDILGFGEGRSVAIGFGRRCSVETAAFINGHSAHVAELDDGARYGAIHPGAPILSALLPLAEKERVTSDAFLLGLVVGYEAAIRLATAVQPSHYKRGYHPTATCGTIGAALGVAAMLGFTSAQMKDALSVAATSATGSLKVLEDDSELKPFNAGRAAQAGLIAAAVARAGFKGAADPLGGAAGFLAMMADEADSSRLEEAKDGSYCIEKVYFKPYASCRHTHSPIEAALAVQKQHGLGNDEIESVKVITYEGVLGKHDHSIIQGVASAKMSIPFSVAVALVIGRAGLPEFEPSMVSDSKILELTRKVAVCGDPELTALVPRKRAAIVEIAMRDGRICSGRVDFPMGEPENPMSDDELWQKFLTLAAYGGKSDAEARALGATILSPTGCLNSLFAFL